MTGPDYYSSIDPWEAPIDELASLARQIESYADADSRDLSSVESQRRFAAHILEVLNARATIDAADRQRKGIERLARATTAAAKVQEETANRIAQAAEKQSRFARLLVWATWALVLATIVLALTT